MSIKNIVLMALICVAVCLAGAYLKYDDPMRCILLIVPAIMLFKVKKILMNQ